VKSKSVPSWVADHTQYLNGNAASSPSSPIVLNNGEHPSHIFTFSRVFAEEDLEDICSRLNLTDYKVVVCCVDLGHITKGVFVLKDAVELEDRVKVTISGGGESYGCRVFVRVAPPPR